MGVLVEEEEEGHLKEIQNHRWLQKAAWNRIVIHEKRKHKSPTTCHTTTWTVDFLTRSGEGRKVLGLVTTVPYIA